MKAVFYVVTGVLVVAGAMVVLAMFQASSPDGRIHDACFADSRADQNDKVQACTSIINSPRFSADDITRAYGARALANAALRRYENASSDADQAISRIPDLKSFGDRCAVNIIERHYQKALEDCTTALYSVHGAEDSNLAGVYLLKSIAYEQEGQYLHAINNTEQAIVLDPNNAIAFATRCDIRNILGHPTDALADCNKAIALDANGESGFSARAFTNLKRGSYGEAARDFETALKLDPSLPIAIYGRGLVERHDGKIAKAEIDFATAKRIDTHVTDDIAQYGLKP